MLAERHRSVILKLEIVADVQRIADAVAAVGEGAGDGNGGAEIGGVFAEAIARELKAGLVDNRGTDDIGVGSLDDLLGVAGIVALRGEGEEADAVVRVVGNDVAVTQGEGVVFVACQSMRGLMLVRVRDRRRLRLNGVGLKLRIENDGVDDGCVADVAALGVEEEGGLFRWAAKLPLKRKCVIGRFGADERISGIEGGVVGIEEKLAVILVGAGLGENFDAADSRADRIRRRRDFD